MKPQQILAFLLEQGSSGICLNGYRNLLQESLWIIWNPREESLRITATFRNEILYICMYVVILTKGFGCRNVDDIQWMDNFRCRRSFIKDNLWKWKIAQVILTKDLGCQCCRIQNSAMMDNFICRRIIKDNFFERNNWICNFFKKNPFGCRIIQREGAT